MDSFLELLKQRRVWAGLVGFLTFGLGMFGVVHELDSAELTELLVAFGQALGALIPAALALWSYILPKK